MRRSESGACMLSERRQDVAAPGVLIMARRGNASSWRNDDQGGRWIVQKGGKKKEKWHEGVIYLLVYLFPLFPLSLPLPFFRSQTDDEIAADAPGRPGNWYQDSEIRLYLCSDSFIYG